MATKVKMELDNVKNLTEVRQVFTEIAEQIRRNKNIKGLKHVSFDKNILLLTGNTISGDITKHFKRFASKDMLERKGGMLRAFEYKELPNSEAGGENKSDQETGPQEVLLQVDDNSIKEFLKKITKFQGIDDIFIDQRKKQVKLVGIIDVANLAIKLEKYCTKNDVVQNVISSKGNQGNNNEGDEKKNEDEAKSGEEHSSSLSPKLKDVVVQFKDSMSSGVLEECLKVEGVNAVSVVSKSKIKVSGNINVAELAKKLKKPGVPVASRVSSVVVKKGLKKSNFAPSSGSTNVQFKLQPEGKGGINWQKVMETLATYENIERVSIKREDLTTFVTGNRDAVSINGRLKAWNPKILRAGPVNQDKDKEGGEKKKDGSNTNPNPPIIYHFSALLPSAVYMDPVEVEHETSCTIM